MKFIVDKEISLGKQDLLNTQSYATTLKEVILNTPEDTAFTVGLFGEWGSGKSSIIKTVQEDVEKSANPKIKFIVYDAWKYANDSFRRMFLFKVQQELKHEKNAAFASFYRSKNSDVKVNRKVDSKYVIATGGLFLVGLLLISLIKDTATDLKITVTLVIAFLGVMVNVLGRAFNDYKVTVQEPMIFAPEQFEECFDEMISLSLEPNSTLQTIKKWVKGDNYISGLEKIVIVIDNIDRCPKEVAYELITNIKNFLGNKRKLVFLVPVDDEALKRHIEKGGSATNKEAEEFLRKFFNITLRIKPFKRFDLYDFTNAINLAQQSYLNPTTVDIISKEYATNPRRIIQFFNNLTAELQVFKVNHDESFIKKNESLICKMLLLREEWPAFYKKISINPSLLNNPDEALLNDINRQPDLNSFLNVTESISRSENYNVIETVLSTGDRTLQLPSDLEEAIQKMNLEVIEANLTDKRVEHKKLVSVLIEKLNTGLKRQAFQTDANNLFQIICWLDSKSELADDENTRVYNESKYYLERFLPYVIEYDQVCRYSNLLLEKGLNYIDNWFFGYCEKSIGSENNEFPVGRIIFRKYLQNQNDSKRLQKCAFLFLNEYKKNNFIIAEYELSGSQLAELLDFKLVDFATEKMENLTEGDKFYKDLAYLGGKINFSPEMVHVLFTRINAFFPNFANQEKESVLKIMSSVIPLIKDQENVIGEDTKAELENFYNSIFLKRTVRGNNLNVISEDLKGEEINIVVTFLFAVHRISNGTINIIDNIRKLALASPEAKVIIYTQLIDLKNRQQVNMAALKDFVLEDNTFTVENLEITDHLVSNKDANHHHLISEDKVSAKFGTMLSVYETENSLLPAFLDKMSEQDRNKVVLTNIITTLEREKILRLSPTLQTLAFDRIADGDNIFDYADNMNFLKAMAETGTPDHNSAITKLIITKLARHEQAEQGIEILEHINKLKPADKSKIEPVIADLGNDNLIERAKAALGKF